MWNRTSQIKNRKLDNHYYPININCPMTILKVPRESCGEHF